MSRLLLRSEKCQWSHPYRSGGRLDLMEINYDGKQWYKVVAVGSEMKDNLLRFSFPTNIDHIQNLEDAVDIFETFVHGPDSDEWESKSAFSKMKFPEMTGFTPNVYFDDDMLSVANVETSKDGVIERLAGSGGIITFNPKMIKEKAKRWGISERDAWNSTIRHEFKHFDDNRNKGTEDEHYQREIDAIHEEMESLLEIGAEINIHYVSSFLTGYDIDESSAIVMKWIRDWKKKYHDFHFEGTMMYLKTGDGDDNEEEKCLYEELTRMI